MKTIVKEIRIDAKPSTIWHVLTDQKMFRQWSKAFHPAATFIGEIKQSNHVTFIDDEGHGIETLVTKCLAPHVLAYQYLQELGAFEVEADFNQQYERYTITQNESGCLLTIELSIVDRFYEGMKDMWDQAILDLKSICEKSPN